MIEGYLNTKQAGEKLGVTTTQVRHLITIGNIAGVKVGHDWLVLTSTVDAYAADRPRPGPKRKRRRYRVKSKS